MSPVSAENLFKTRPIEDQYLQRDKDISLTLTNWISIKK